MSNTQSPDQTKGDEIPLEDIDKILAQEDPEFAKSLEEVRSVENDQNVVIEASALDESEIGGTTEREGAPAGFIRRKVDAVKMAIVAFRLRIRNRIAQAMQDTLVWLKTRPKEYALYLFALSKILAKKSAVPVRTFMAASKTQKLTVVVLLTLSGAAIWVLGANIKGVWIPHLTEPILSDLGDHADFVETYDPKDGAESFYSAFPQDVHQFLFSKMKVNLKRTAQNPLPMGAFEVVVEVDSKDTAVELRDREVELHDELQRLFEEETATDLEQELGKGRLKGRIKKSLNEKLTQGWIKEVHFKTFILKP